MHNKKATRGFTHKTKEKGSSEASKAGDTRGEILELEKRKGAVQKRQWEQMETS